MWNKAALFKFLFVVIMMFYLYPIFGVVTYAITNLCQVSEKGNLFEVILMRGVHVLSILVVSFLVGLLFPKDRWIIRPAVIISILYYFFSDIESEMYVARHIPHGSLSAYAVISVIIQYLLIFFITYWLSVLFHHFGQILRGQLRAEI